jgi:hypothetical protein
MVVVVVCERQGKKHKRERPEQGGGKDNQDTHASAGGNMKEGVVGSMYVKKYAMRDDGWWGVRGRKKKSKKGVGQ